MTKIDQAGAVASAAPSPVAGSASLMLGRLFKEVGDQDRVAARAYMIAKFAGDGPLQTTRQELFAAGISADAQPAVIAGLAYLGALSARPFAFEATLAAAVSDHTQQCGCKIESKAKGFMAHVETFADEVGRVGRATFEPTVRGVGTVLDDGVAKPLAAVGGAIELVIDAGIVQPVTTVVRDGVVKPAAATLKGVAAIPAGLAPGVEAVGKSVLMALSLGFWRPRRR